MLASVTSPVRRRAVRKSVPARNGISWSDCRASEAGPCCRHSVGTRTRTSGSGDSTLYDLIDQKPPAARSSSAGEDADPMRCRESTADQGRCRTDDISGRRQAHGCARGEDEHAAHKERDAHAARRGQGATAVDAGCPMTNSLHRRRGAPWQPAAVDVHEARMGRLAARSTQHRAIEPRA